MAEVGARIDDDVVVVTISVKIDRQLIESWKEAIKKAQPRSAQRETHYDQLKQHEQHIRTRLDAEYAAYRNIAAAELTKLCAVDFD